MILENLIAVADDYIDEHGGQNPSAGVVLGALERVARFADADPQVVFETMRAVIDEHSELIA